MARTVSGNGDASPTGARRLGIEIVLAAVSVTIYAATIFVLPQNRVALFDVERSSLAAAVSSIVYHAPFGALYSGVLKEFLEHPEAPLQPIFDQLRENGTPLGELLTTVGDGNGVGYVPVAAAALRLFGLHAWGLPLFMIGLMGVSAAVFLWRFRAQFAGVVTLSFTALTVMLFTPLVWDPQWAGEIAVGGIRYFSLVAILPAFHIVFELMDTSEARDGAARRNYLLLACQAAVFASAVLVRASAGALVGAIAVVGLALAWQSRRTAKQLRPLSQKGATVVLVGAGVVAALIVSVTRDYWEQGRFATLFWHRAVISLGVNPEWPDGFGAVREAFDCKRYIPEGLQLGMPDRNGHCIWCDYAIKHHLSDEEIVQGVYGGRYELAMREAFFTIAWHYPRQVLVTFFYYKPAYIIWSVVQSLKSNMNEYPPIAVGLLGFTLLNLLACFSTSTMPVRNSARIAGTALMFAALSTLPSMVAWALPHTIADLLFYCIFCAGIALAVVSAAARAALRRAPSVQPTL
jgi:hypothetical protein